MSALQDADRKKPALGMNRIDRLTGMILLLQSQRLITAEQVAAHFEISVRTVYRDFSALGEAGVPIVAERAWATA